MFNAVAGVHIGVHNVLCYSTHRVRKHLLLFKHHLAAIVSVCPSLHLCVCSVPFLQSLPEDVIMKMSDLMEEVQMKRMKNV